MKEKILKEKQNLFIIGAIILAIVVIVIVLVCTTSKDKETETITEDKLEKKLEKVGIEFYEDRYYTGLVEAEREEKLTNLAETGIKINLTNVELLVPIEEDVKNQLKNDNCDFDKTIISIYPQEPYGQKDYEIKIELSCEK